MGNVIFCYAFKKCSSMAMDKAMDELDHQLENNRSADSVSLTAEEFEQHAEMAIPAVVRMISGCADSQTSADVSNTKTFELPADTGPGGAGGACTNALISLLTKGPGKCTWVMLLEEMRLTLKSKGFTQVPQLSASRKIEVCHDEFSLNHPNASSSSKKKALLIGINYTGQKGELRGCHNDVKMMKQYLESQDFSASSSDMLVLLDDGQHQSPTRSNILDAFDWLVADVQENDALFLHYSGHGGQEKDLNGDEKSGFDDTLVPVDYQSSGQIIDDILFEKLVMPLPAGSQLTALMDCCHSGTILDLPYEIKATEALGPGAQMVANPGFSFAKLLEVAKNLYAAKRSGATNTQLIGMAAKDLMPMLAESARKHLGGSGGAGGAGAGAGGGGGGETGLPGGIGNLASLFLKRA